MGGLTGRIESRWRDIVPEERDELPDVSLLVYRCQPSTIHRTRLHRTYRKSPFGECRGLCSVCGRRSLFSSLCRKYVNMNGRTGPDQTLGGRAGGEEAGEGGGGGGVLEAGREWGGFNPGSLLLT